MILCIRRVLNDAVIDKWRNLNKFKKIIKTVKTICVQTFSVTMAKTEDKIVRETTRKNKFA